MFLRQWFRPVPFRLALALAVGSAFVAVLGSAARADDATAVGSLTIEHAWARPTDAMAKSGAAYFVLKNAGDTADRLVSVATDVAETAQLHTVTETDGMLRMRPIAGIDIPAKGRAELKPGAMHVMLVNPKRQLKLGQRFPLTLTFAKAGAVTVQVRVEQEGAAGTKTGDSDMKHDDMGGMKMDDGMGGMKH
jgi:copper(I)-binding protein